MGSIGSVMKGSGLEEALETTYGPNTVTNRCQAKQSQTQCVAIFWWKVHWLISWFLHYYLVNLKIIAFGTLLKVVEKNSNAKDVETLSSDEVD